MSKLGNISSRPLRVIVMSPPLARSGGIGTLYSYAQPHFSNAVSVRFIDTRGLNNNPAFSLFHLLKAALIVSILRVSGKVDLVHFNFGARGAAARKMSLLAWCSYVLQLPTVAQLHTSTFEDFVLGLPAIVRKSLLSALNRADLILVLGTIWKEMLTRLGIKESKIQIYVMGVSSLGQRVESKPTTDAYSNLDILFAGDLAERKGLPYLLEAITEPGLEHVRLIVAGSGDLAYWRSKCKVLEIDDRVALLGWVRNDLIHKLLIDMDVMILPSRHEGLPVSVLEGLSAGVCVVATPVGALPEVLSNGEDSLFIEELSAHAIANALRKITVTSYRNALAQGGLSTWLNQFNVKVTTPKLEAAWKETYTKSKSFRSNTNTHHQGN